jgi:L,D-transpeptidase YcbB
VSGNWFLEGGIMILKQRLRRNFGFRKYVAIGFALGLALPVLMAPVVKAESESSEQDRLDRLNKLKGGTTLRGGKVKTSTNFHAPSGGGPAVTQTEVLADQTQIPMLTTHSDSDLLAAQTKYAAIAAQGGFPKVPSGSYKKGSEGAGVGALNKRLFVEGYLRAEATQGDVAAVFTTATADAVSRFQRNMGIGVTGKVDGATLAELNVSADTRLRTIGANIPRLAIYEQDLGGRYLIVNIPAQQIETVNNGHVYSRHNAIVGRPERPSPVVMTPLETVKFNPYWNAPVSIVERDLIPKIQANINILSDMNMKVFQGVGGPEIDPKTVNWSNAVPDDYSFRQEPGPENAMKTAKIEFNSTFGIYLHDTPEPQLFKTSNRFYSSGCIRVEKMPLLVQWVLNGQDGFGEGKIASMAETLERLDVKIAAPPQLRVTYLTAWPTNNGTVAFRHDVYGMDGSGFTVGQPMPVGENSPDGLRYVLKPLPRQVPVDVAEAEGFHLFGFRSGARPATATGAKKNMFGKTLFAATKVSTDATPVDTVVSPVNPKPLKGKIAKANAKLSENKGFGLFDWAAYRKQQAAEAKAPKGKKKAKKLDAVAKADTAKLKSDTKKTGVDKKLAAAAPGKPAVKILKPGKPKLEVAMADPCAADAKGKVPKDCQPAVKK